MDILWGIPAHMSRVIFVAFLQHSVWIDENLVVMREGDRLGRATGGWK